MKEVRDDGTVYGTCDRCGDAAPKLYEQKVSGSEFYFCAACKAGVMGSTIKWVIGIAAIIAFLLIVGLPN